MGPPGVESREWRGPIGGTSSPGVTACVAWKTVVLGERFDYRASVMPRTARPVAADAPASL
jgi:hypothetical protein